MKRLFTLVALLGLLGVFAGCNPSENKPEGGAGTNAAPAAPGTNATK